MKHTKKNKKVFISFFILTGLLFICLFILYGPFPQFRLLWINTAVYSSHFKWLARLFYSEKYISGVIEQNEIPKELRTDDSPLINKWDDSIFFSEINNSHYKGYLIRIHDPRRIMFVKSSLLEGELLEELIDKYESTGGINASGYLDSYKHGIAWGAAIVNDSFIANNTYEPYSMGGFTHDYKLVAGNFSRNELWDIQYMWALEFTPFLIINGQKTELSSFYGGLAPRTAIGQTVEGHVLLLVIDGRRIQSVGASFQDIQNILYENGAINAFNLDGGHSTSMVYKNKLVNSPSRDEAMRKLPNAIIYK
jgi:exopolysaccharide biosynthesis protein